MRMSGVRRSRGHYKGDERNVMKGKEWRKEEEKEDEGEAVEDK